MKVVLLAHAGWKYSEIAAALLLHPDTVVQHVQDYVENKKLGLASGGKDEKLNSAQTLALEAELDRVLYSKTADICARVKTRFAVEYTNQGMTEWLHRHNYSWENPVWVPTKANPKQQKNFRRAYAKHKKTLPENDVIVFTDASHPTMATKIGKSWIKVGVERPIQTVASRTE